MAVVFNETSLTTPKTIFWTNQEHQSNRPPDAFIPGVNDVGNQRPMKMSQFKMREVKVKSSGSDVKVKSLVPQVKAKSSRSDAYNLKPSPEKINLIKSESDTRVTPTDPPSLKDLRAEDKLRVANLIKELAKIGEEKEKAVELMHTERLVFEKQILSLLEQQELILKDRHHVQTQLEKYQHQLEEVQTLDEKNQHVKNSPREKFSDGKKLSPQKEDGNLTSSSEGKEEDDVQLQNRRKSHRKHERSRSSNQLIMPRQSDSESQDRGYVKSPKSKRPVARSLEDDLNQTMKEQRVKVNSKSSPKFKDTVRSRVKESQGSTHYGENFHGTRQNELLIDFSKNQNGFDEDRKDIQEKQSFRTPPRRSRPSDIKRKLLTHGPLPEPIMSSTQKSSEMYEDMSFKSRSSPEHFYPLQVDSDPRTTRQSFTELSPHRRSSGNNRYGDRQDERIPRVNFRTENEFSDDCPMHSPNLYGNNALDDFDDADPNFIAYYRKLSPRFRKQELLSQRDNLLEEQNRLRHILIEQENMLKLKREQLRQQQMVQAQRLAHFEQTGEFPLADRDVLRDDFQGRSSLRTVKPENVFRNDFQFALRSSKPENFISARLTVPRAGNPVMGDNHVQSIIPNKPEILGPPNPPQRVNMVSTATSPLATSPDRRLSMAASPLITTTTTTPRRQEKTTPTKTYTDAATSYSVAIETQTDSSLTSPGRRSRQGNLPLSTNRQRSNYNPSTQLNSSIDKKGFSVLEILEKLESPLNSSRSSQRSFHSDTGGALYPSTKDNNSNMNNENGLLSHQSISDEESLAELEESKVLEDVFFLK